MSIASRTSVSLVRGFTVVEALIAISVFSLIVTAIVGSIIYGQESGATAGMRARAMLLADEGVEAARTIRDRDFSGLAVGSWGIIPSGNQWILSGTSTASDIFLRRVVITAPDAHSRQIASEVTWQQTLQRPGSVTSVTYLTNWKKRGIGDWSNPALAQTLDFPGTQAGKKIKIQENFAYVVRSGGAPNFYVIDISTASSTIVGSLTLAGTPTNIAVQGNYAYVSNTNTSGEMQIVDITNPAAPSLTRTYNAPASAAANGIAVVGTRAYLVQNTATNNFNIVNVANPSAPVSLGSGTLGGPGNGIYVSGNYAYIANGSNAQELQVVDVSNAAAPSIVGSYNLQSSFDGVCVTGFDEYIVMGRTGNNQSLYIFDVSTPTTPVLVSSTLTASGSIYDVAMGNDNTYAFLATAAPANNLQIVDLTTPASPALLGSLSVGVVSQNGVAYDPTLDRAYVVGSDTTQEFIHAMPQ